MSTAPHHDAEKKNDLAISFLVPLILNIIFVSVFSTVDDALGEIVLVCVGGIIATAQPMMWKAHYTREQFFDEFNHGSYEVKSFLTAKFTLELLHSLVQAAVASFASRYILGLTGLLPAYVMTAALVGLAFTSTSLFFAEATRRQKLGGLLAFLVFLPQLLFAGLFYHISRIPVWLRWIQHLCPLKHAINVLVYWEFVHGNKTTELAKMMEANLDLPKAWWHSALSLVAIILSLQFFAANIMWIHALRVSEARYRWRSIKRWGMIFLLGGKFMGYPGVGTEMRPPCKRTWKQVTFAEPMWYV